jgi:hypothetical protein
MTRSGTRAALALLACAIAASAAAQKLDAAKPLEAGDRAVFNWALNGKAQQIEEEYTTAEGGRPSRWS